jgi:hypothetical protein
VESSKQNLPRSLETRIKREFPHFHSDGDGGLPGSDKAQSRVKSRPLTDYRTEPKKFWISWLLLGVGCLPALAKGQSTGYQAGKIVNVERQPRTGGGGDKDAALHPETATYKISVQVNDTVYLVRYQAHGDQDLS